MAGMELVAQTLGPTLTGVAAIYAAVWARKAHKNTNTVEGKSVSELAQEARDESIHTRRSVELHVADTNRHVY